MDWLKQKEEEAEIVEGLLFIESKLYYKTGIIKKGVLFLKPE